MLGPVEEENYGEKEEEDAFVDTFGPRIADDLWTSTRPAFTQ